MDSLTVQTTSLKLTMASRRLITPNKQGKKIVLLSHEAEDGEEIHDDVVELFGVGGENVGVVEASHNLTNEEERDEGIGVLAEQACMSKGKVG